MPTTHKLISSSVLGANATSFTFSSIPQTYKDLIVLATVRGTANLLDYFNVIINSDTSAAYSGNQMATQSAGTPFSNSAVNNSPSDGNIDGRIPANNTNAAAFGNSKLIFSHYTSSMLKSFTHESIVLHDVSTTYVSTMGGFWNNTAAITSIQFKPYNTGAAQFVAGSEFYLYGRG
jgi:hypothetical protein